MARRKVIFATGEFYHIFNKTVGKEMLFDRKRAFNRALALVEYYRYKQAISYSHYKQLSEAERFKKDTSLLFPIVSIYACAFMPNHFHFLVRQNEPGGIVSFVSNFQNGLARYYNKLFDRSGSLFKEQFKGVRIESEEEVFHVSRYIHLNRVTSYCINLKQLENDEYSSYSTYTGKFIYPFIDTSLIENKFKSVGYSKYVLNQADYQKTLHDLRHLYVDK